MAFRVGTEKLNGRTIYTLQDDTSGAKASILPSFGFNLFDLRLPAGGESRRIIMAAPGWEGAPTSPGRHGIPVLFPFPNRIKDARYTFGGKEYQLPATNGKNAIHGFAISAPWDVVEHAASADEAFIVGRFQLSRHAPEAMTMWPADAILQIRYGLAGRKLTLDATVTNPTNQPLPFGFGIHPYFRLPMNPGTDLSRTSVILPASEYWVLDDFVPTGQRAPVDARLDFRQGQSMMGLKLDDVLTGLAFEGDRCTARLVDLALNAEIRLSFDKSFRELVVYTPPGAGDLISLEPYTQTTDAINLKTRGIDGGLRVLEHGQEARLSIAIETRG